MVDGRPQRKELLPLPRTQLKLVTVVCLPIVLTCIIVTALQLYFFITSETPNMSLENEFAQRIVRTAIYIAAITLLVLVPTFILVSVWISHRILGPMRRLSARLERIAEGKIGTDFHFREGDELTFMADAVVKMEDSLRERLEACRSAEGEAEIRERLAAFELPVPPEVEEDQGVA